MRKNIAEEISRDDPVSDQGRRTAKTKDIADAMGIKPPSVSEMLGKLKDQGYVEYQPYVGATLTEKGRAEAVQMERKHQLLETFLVDTLGVEPRQGPRGGLRDGALHIGRDRLQDMLLPGAP